MAWIRSLRPYVRPQLRTFLGLHGEQLARQGGEALIRLDVDGHQGHDSSGLPGFIGMEEALCGSSTGELGVKRGSGALVIQHTSHAPIAAFRLEMRVSYSGSDNRASVTSEPEQITTTPEQAKSADTPTPLLPRSAQPQRGQAGYVINEASATRFLPMVLPYGQSSQERGRGCSPPSINWLSGIAMTEQVLLEAPEPHRPRCSVRSSIQNIMRQYSNSRTRFSLLASWRRFWAPTMPSMIACTAQCSSALQAARALPTTAAVGQPRLMVDELRCGRQAVSRRRLGLCR